MLDEFLGGAGKYWTSIAGDGVTVAKRRQKWDKQGELITRNQKHVAKV